MRQTTLRLLRAGVVLVLCLLASLWSLKRLSGDVGWIEIGDDEVAVIYNQVNGSTREAIGPGNELFLPFIERVWLQRRSPRQLLLEGSVRETAGVVPEVRLRAADGSLVRLGALAVRYALLPNAAQQALEDTGGEETSAVQLVESFTRAIVRDEYGRFSAEEILLRENQNEANVVALQRLARALEGHGIEVLELSAPKLRFDGAYEKSVEDRKLAYQEIERLKVEFRQLDAERDQRLAALEKQKLIEYNETQLQIREYMETIERDGRERSLKARQYGEDRRSDGTNRQYELEQQALALTEQVSLRSDLLREEIEAMAQTGPALVREAWIQNLAKTTFQLQPFSHDPHPAGIELLKTALASQ